MPYGDPARIARGYACCPDCYARLTGYADVTLHPLIRVDSQGQVTLGKHTDSPTQIARSVQSETARVLSDELTCSRVCGYRIAAADLRERVRRAG